MSLYQFLNFICSLLNYFRSKTILFGIYISNVIYTNITSIYILNMLLNAVFVVLVSSKVSYLVILNNSSNFFNASILVAQFDTTAFYLVLIIMSVQLLESKTIDLVFFLTSFFILFYFLILDLGLEISIILYITVIEYHTFLHVI